MTYSLKIHLSIRLCNVHRLENIDITNPKQRTRILEMQDVSAWRSRSIGAWLAHDYAISNEIAQSRAKDRLLLSTTWAVSKTHQRWNFQTKWNVMNKFFIIAATRDSRKIKVLQDVENCFIFVVIIRCIIHARKLCSVFYIFCIAILISSEVSWNWRF